MIEVLLALALGALVFWGANYLFAVRPSEIRFQHEIEYDIKWAKHHGLEPNDISLEGLRYSMLRDRVSGYKFVRDERGEKVLEFGADSSKKEKFSVKVDYPPAGATRYIW